MYTYFYSNIYKFAVNLEVILDEGMHKRTIKIMHKIGWKYNYFKSDDVSMLVHGCWASQFTQLYDRIKIYIKYYHVCMWELMSVKRVAYF